MRCPCPNRLNRSVGHPRQPGQSMTSSRMRVTQATAMPKRRALLGLVQAPDRDRDEHQVVDAQHDFDRAEGDQGDPRLGSVRKVQSSGTLLVVRRRANGFTTGAGRGSAPNQDHIHHQHEHHRAEPMSLARRPVRVARRRSARSPLPWNSSAPSPSPAGGCRPAGHARRRCRQAAGQRAERQEQVDLRRKERIYATRPPAARRRPFRARSTPAGPRGKMCVKIVLLLFRMNYRRANRTSCHSGGPGARRTRPFCPHGHPPAREQPFAGPALAYHGPSLRGAAPRSDPAGQTWCRVGRRTGRWRSKSPPAISPALRLDRRGRRTLPPSRRADDANRDSDPHHRSAGSTWPRQELPAHVARAGAHRHAQADLADALGDRDQP